MRGGVAYRRDRALHRNEASGDRDRTSFVPGSGDRPEAHHPDAQRIPAHRRQSPHHAGGPAVGNGNGAWPRAGRAAENRTAPAEAVDRSGQRKRPAPGEAGRFRAFSAAPVKPAPADRSRRDGGRYRLEQPAVHRQMVPAGLVSRLPQTSQVRASARSR